MKVYIFDVDGTLTPSRQMMTKKFAKFFDKWSEENKYYLVTGSDLDKTKEQLPIAYIDRAEGIFTCCGNQFYINDKLIYENTFKPPENLLTYLGEQLRMSDYFARCGNHIENRGSMLNFSVVGRNCSLEERKTYFEYDSTFKEREKIAQYITEQWRDIDAVIGGQISIDIYPKGMDKSQVVEHIEDIEEKYCPDKYIFIGDRTMKGGNDYPLAKLMTGKCFRDFYQTEGPEQTQKILEKLSD